MTTVLTRKLALPGRVLVSLAPATLWVYSTNLSILDATRAGFRSCLAEAGSSAGSHERCSYIWLGPDAGYLGLSDWLHGLALTAIGLAIIFAAFRLFAWEVRKIHAAGRRVARGLRSPSGAYKLWGKLWRDRSGNTLALVAAGLLPLLAIVGGAVDMSRAYLAQNRLQAACDSGVLAARKRLGSDIVTSGEVSPEVAYAGNAFFNVNYRAGAYGTESRTFELALEDDYAISGTAAVTLPTAVMKVFGYNQFDINVTCEARLNYSNTDIMMVLDTTGSMRETNPGDTQPRIDVLRGVVKTFYQQINGSKAPGTRIRFGFVPYSTNVNVGALLKDEWVVSNWSYQSREDSGSTTSSGTRTYYANQRRESGSYVSAVHSTYPATYNLGNEITGGSYSCNTPAPANSYTQETVIESTTSESVVGPPAGTRTTEHYRRTTNGKAYSISRSGSTCYVYETTYDTYVDSFDRITEPYNYITPAWTYKPIEYDVSGWRTASNGCIEERATYEISDYNNVDLSQALDLNLDLVPTAGNSATQWRPMYPQLVYERSLNSGGAGSFSLAPVTTTAQYFRPQPAGMAACPSPAMKLSELTAAQINSYVDGLTAVGSTYHDIGMIWGGRLLSPTGLFASENADVAGKPSSRHLIFLTDGKTETFSKSYGSYGVEPLDRRRWTPDSSLSLTQVVENRFTVACSEVKKKNITVWFIAFGTELNPVFTACAGEGHSFQASNAAELDLIFSKIAAAMGDLRVSR